MTDPRELLGAAGAGAPEVDLVAVRARARQLQRRRTALVAGASALVLVLSGGVALGLERAAREDRLVPPVATEPPSPVPSSPAPPSPTPAPSATPSGDPVVPPPSRAASPSGASRPASPSGAPRPPSTATSAPGTRPPSPEGGPSRAPSSAPAVPFVADDLPDNADGVPGELLLSAVSTAPQDGYDRTVFTFTGVGDARPGWRVQYVDEAVQDASGEVLPLAGSAVLQVVLTGTPNEESPATGRTTPAGTSLLREVYVGASWEGQTQGFLGLDRRAPFRVFALTSPTRVVVDVRTR